jgi:hypothetical protein
VGGKEGTEPTHRLKTIITLGSRVKTPQEEKNGYSALSEQLLSFPRFCSLIVPACASAFR